MKYKGAAAADVADEPRPMWTRKVVQSNHTMPLDDLCKVLWPERLQMTNSEPSLEWEEGGGTPRMGAASEELWVKQKQTAEQLGVQVHR